MANKPPKIPHMEIPRDADPYSYQRGYLDGFERATEIALAIIRDSRSRKRHK